MRFAGMDDRRIASRPAGSLTIVGLAIAGTLLAAACAPAYPPIADVGGDAAFKARIATAFPPGSRAAPLRARLLAEGFEVVDDPATRLHSAIVKPENLPCRSETRIDWREDRRGRITEIQAARHGCT